MRRIAIALALTQTLAVKMMHLMFLFEEAYTDFSGLTAGVDPLALERSSSGHTNDDVSGFDLPGGLKTLHTLANVPKSWPLARLTIPLSGFSKQLERLLKGYCMEVSVTNSSLELQLHYVKIFFFASMPRAPLQL